MSTEKFYNCIVLSMVKHDYIGLAIEAHPRTKLVAVADDADNPSWVHERNLEFAQRHNIPYIMDIEKVFQDYSADFVVICSEAERHCDLAVRAGEVVRAGRDHGAADVLRRLVRGAGCGVRLAAGLARARGARVRGRACAVVRTVKSGVAYGSGVACCGAGH